MASLHGNIPHCAPMRPVIVRRVLEMRQCRVETGKQVLPHVSWSVLRQPFPTCFERRTRKHAQVSRSVALHTRGRGSSRTSSDRTGYFGWGTIRRYGFGAFHPPGYFFLASSFETLPLMTTSSPGFQFTGVETWCLAVSCNESRTRITSSKLRPVLIGYISCSLIFLSGPMTNTVRTVALSAGVRPCEVLPLVAGNML